ncbi:MAG: sugar phosphate isomerase/epimerase [Planctomycetes bacterium]|nr:sugar phosphate isomerase/epimerase [Planctomycetota bacterium]
MTVNRRDFLHAAGLTSAAAALGSGALGARGAQAAEEEAAVALLKLSSQEGRIPGESLPEKVERMAQWGFTGIEPHGGGLPGRVAEIQQALQGSGVSLSAVCAGYSGCLISHQESERRLAVDTLKELLAAAGELRSTGVIVVPAFHGQTELGCEEARKILVDLLKELGEHAVAVKSRILLEPLNRGECFFLRLVADAAAIARDAGSEGVAVMGDFYHMNIEETSDRGAFLSAGPRLHHVHLASRRRVLPGQDERSFVDGFRGLKEIGYQDFLSLECGCDGDPLVEIPKSVEFLRAQWARA